jgi:hypothetical protein
MTSIRLLENIPAELRAQKKWAGFKIVGDSKKPCIADAPGKHASSTDPTTWRDFDTAVAGLERGNYHAIAYALTGDYVGVDLDGCFKDGQLTPLADDVVKRCNTFTEYSYSGDGIHAWIKGTFDGPGGKKVGGIEVYTKGRFFICTGTRIPHTQESIQSRPEAVAWLLRGNDTETLEAIPTPPPPSPLPLTGSAVSVSYTLSELISLTCPKRPGERNNRVFDFARGLRLNMRMDTLSLHPAAGQALSGTYKESGQRVNFGLV